MANGNIILIPITIQHITNTSNCPFPVNIATVVFTLYNKQIVLITVKYFLTNHGDTHFR